MEIFDDPSVDLGWEGAYHYDRSIALLMEMLRRVQKKSSPNSPDDTASVWETSRYAGSVHGSKGRHRSSHVGTAGLRSDIVAAVCYPNAREYHREGLM